MKISSDISFEKVNECEKLAFKMELVQKSINEKVRSAPLDTMSKLNAFIEPQNSIKKVIDFYKIFIAVEKAVKTNRAFLESEVPQEKEFNHIKLLKNKEFLGKMETILTSIKKVYFYNKVLIVSEFLRSHEAFIEKNLHMCENSFLHSLRKDLPSYEELGIEFCRFLIRNRDRKSFFDKYAKAFYDKFRFRSFESRLDEVLEKAFATEGLFEEIDRTNNALLEKEDAENMTRIITEMLMADRKSKVSEVLMNLSKRNKPEDIAFIIALSSFFRIPQNKLGSVFRHLEDLRSECLKLANNLLITLYEKIGLTTTANKFCDTEPFVIQANTILRGMIKNKGFATEIIMRCDFVSSKTVEELCDEFGTKCYEKIEEILVTVTGVRRHIYLINNFYVLQNFLKEYNNRRLSDYITEAKREILDVWRRECDKRKGLDVTSFLDTNLEIQKRYFLPSDIRQELMEHLSGIIADMVESSIYNGSKKAALEQLSQLFSGK